MHTIAKAPSLSFGIEEEFHLVDVKTRELAVAPKELLSQLEMNIGSQVSPEFLRSQIEVGTKPVTTFAAARAELNRLRKMVVDAAHQHGLAPLASGTHPFVQPDETETTDKERYNDLDRDLAGAIRGLAACGMHVHAGIEDEAYPQRSLNNHPDRETPRLVWYLWAGRFAGPARRGGAQPDGRLPPTQGT